MAHPITLSLDDEAYKIYRSMGYGERSKLVSSMFKDSVAEETQIPHSVAPASSGTQGGETRPEGAEADRRGGIIQDDNGEHQEAGDQSTPELRPGELCLQFGERVPPDQEDEGGGSP